MTEGDRHDDDLQLFRAFIAKSRWRFAKTYVESYPHEYTLQRWRNVIRERLASAAVAIYDERPPPRRFSSARIMAMQTAVHERGRA